MLRRCGRVLQRYYGGRMVLDMKLSSTLEPHAEIWQVDSVPVDTEVSGLVLPLEFGHRGQQVNILKEVFRSWPRLYHQREFKRSYPGADEPIEVLELGPFELLLGGLERPAVVNVQFSSELPRREDGQPDIRIGADIARRTHYLAPELCEGGQLPPKGGWDASFRGTCPAGVVPPAQPARHAEGTERLYPDDKVRHGWAVSDGTVAEEPPVPLSRRPDRVAEQWAERVALAEEARQQAGDALMHGDAFRQASDPKNSSWWKNENSGRIQKEALQNVTAASTTEMEKWSRWREQKRRSRQDANEDATIESIQQEDGSTQDAPKGRDLKFDSLTREMKVAAADDVYHQFHREAKLELQREKLELLKRERAAREEEAQSQLVRQRMVSMGHGRRSPSQQSNRNTSPSYSLSRGRHAGASGGGGDAETQSLVQEWKRAHAQRDFATSDRIRDTLRRRGVDPRERGGSGGWRPGASRDSPPAPQAWGR